MSMIELTVFGDLSGYRVFDPGDPVEHDRSVASLHCEQGVHETVGTYSRDRPEAQHTSGIGWDTRHSATHRSHRDRTT